MSDIFISYKKEDAGRVVRIVEALRAEGFSVWWDHGITPGAQWDQTIQQQLDVAKVVVAVWSQLSRDAPWVKEESAVGKQRGILVPVRIDNVEPPLGFGLIQAVDLINWSGDAKDPRWAHFPAALKAVLSGKTMAGMDAPLRRRKGPPAWAIGIAALALAGLVGLGVLAGMQNLTVKATNSEGKTYEVEAGRGASTAAPTPALTGVADATEKKLWDKAMETKRREDFQSYLLAYPTGAFTSRARDILLTCRSETRETWKESPVPSNQAVRGVGSVPNDGKTKVQACAAAKAMARKQAEANCSAIANGGGYRNPQWTYDDRDCSCEETSPVATVCIVDAPASCRWEAKIPEQVEICGG
jgi:hypothetical protein